MKRFYIFIILIIIIIVVVSTVAFFNKNDDIAKSEEYIDTEETKIPLQKVNNIEEYYILKSCILKYYYSITSYNSSVLQEDKDYYLQNVYNLIDKEYLESKNIFVNDILPLMTYKDDFDLNIEDILVAKNEDNNMYIFFVEGNLRNLKSNEHNRFSMMVKQDDINKTFNLLPTEYIDDKNIFKLKEGERIEIQFPDKIENQLNNIFGAYNAKFQDYLEDILNQIKEDFDYNQERAYKLLDSSCKITKYRNIYEFKEFINSNKNEIFLLNSDNCIFDAQSDTNIYTFYSEKSNLKIQVNVKNVIEYTYKII